MSCCFSFNSSYRPEIKVCKERIKTLKVIGEEIKQVYADQTIEINAIKIDHVHTELREELVRIFPDKVVKQAVFHVQIFYVDPDNVVRHISTNVPFTIVADIPGVCPHDPFLEIQNHLLNVTTDPILLIPATDLTPGTLELKIIAHILVKASRWTQMDVVTKVDVFPKVNSSCRSKCCY